VRTGAGRGRDLDRQLGGSWPPTWISLLMMDRISAKPNRPNRKMTFSTALSVASWERTVKPGALNSTPYTAGRGGGGGAGGRRRRRTGGGSLRAASRAPRALWVSPGARNTEW
jgi:hypothetical protein